MPRLLVRVAVPAVCAIVTGLSSSVPAHADDCQTVGVTINENTHPNVLVCEPDPGHIRISLPPMI